MNQKRLNALIQLLDQFSAIREQMRQYTTPERRAAVNVRLRRDPDYYSRHLAANREWYARYPDEARERARRYYLANRTSQRKYKPHGD